MQRLRLTREVFENIVWERGALLRPNLSETRLFSQWCNFVLWLAPESFLIRPSSKKTPKSRNPQCRRLLLLYRIFSLLQHREMKYVEGPAAAKFTDFAKIMWKVCQKGPFAQSVLMAKAALAALMSGLLAQPLLHINFSQSTSRFSMRIAECKDLLALPSLLLVKKLRPSAVVPRPVVVFKCSKKSLRQPSLFSRLFPQNGTKFSN